MRVGTLEKGVDERRDGARLREDDEQAEEDEHNDEYTHFYFIGLYEGREVIYDTVMYTLRLQHESELFEIAEHRAEAGRGERQSYPAKYHVWRRTEHGRLLERSVKRQSATSVASIDKG